MCRSRGALVISNVRHEWSALSDNNFVEFLSSYLGLCLCLKCMYGLPKKQNKERNICVLANLLILKNLDVNLDIKTAIYS